MLLPPKFSDEQLKKSRDSGDFTPLLFEHYKQIAGIALAISSVLPESPALQISHWTRYYISAGLLIRCYRLMLANVALSHEGKFGETTAIIDRSIFETAVKLRWLCDQENEDRFVRYLHDSLGPEFEFRSLIQKNIQERGYILPIESRMLSSIARHILATDYSEEALHGAKKLPTLEQMMSDLGFDRLQYVIFQRLGSHHTHGTWSSLLMHYLKEQESSDRDNPHAFRPRSENDCSAHGNHYMAVANLVSHAIESYVKYFLRGEDSESLRRLVTGARKALMATYKLGDRNGI